MDWKNDCRDSCSFGLLLLAVAVAVAALDPTCEAPLLVAVPLDVLVL